MTPHQSIEYHFARYSLSAALLYLGLVFACVLAVIFALAGVTARYQALNQSAEILARYMGRALSPSEPPRGPADEYPVSPFLEGETITIASAALIQRVTSAISRAGGTVISSEVDPQVASKDGAVRVIASCELAQGALQQLLYDIEGGMPFLMIDLLVIQAPPSADQSGRMRALLGVSGQWPSTR
jgi:general secretion pathway protein M